MLHPSSSFPRAFASGQEETSDLVPPAWVRGRFVELLSWDQRRLLGQPGLLRPVFQLLLGHQYGEWEAPACLSPGLQLVPGTGAGALLAGATVGPAKFQPT